MPSDSTLNIYFAGDHFNHKDLMGNAMLAEAISDLSDRRYCCVLPQNFPEGLRTPTQVRDDKLRTLMECDLALFNFDGREIEAGAIVEYMTAKFADMPCVILRTDSRGESDSLLHPWSPMLQYFPRTEVEVLNATSIYQNIFAEFPMIEAEDMLIEERGSEVARTMVRVIAQAAVDAFDRAVDTPPTMSAEDAPAVYRWLAKFFGPIAGQAQVERALQLSLERKQSRGLASPPLTAASHSDIL